MIPHPDAVPRPRELTGAIHFISERDPYQVACGRDYMHVSTTSRVADVTCKRCLAGSVECPACDGCGEDYLAPADTKRPCGFCQGRRRIAVADYDTVDQAAAEREKGLDEADDESEFDERDYA